MRIRRALSILSFCIPALSYAAVIEEILDVPVSVKTIYGQEVNQTIKVTVFRDDQKKKSPYLVLNHGRPASKADHVNMKRQRYAQNAHYFVSLGFVVFVPTRVGYGDSGGMDVEYSGRCNNRNYAPVFAAAADQTLAVLNRAVALPYVDVSRGIVVGQSFGGMTSIALATRELRGLAGTINFAGGGGGNPEERPEEPCSPDRLATLYSHYGAASKVPTLWFYSENDRYWGAELPKKWFKNFVDAGGKAQFVQLPPYQDNGHRIFTGNPGAWKPVFEEFLHGIGF